MAEGNEQSAIFSSSIFDKSFRKMRFSMKKKMRIQNTGTLVMLMSMQALVGSITEKQLNISLIKQEICTAHDSSSTKETGELLEKSTPSASKKRKMSENPPVNSIISPRKRQKKAALPRIKAYASISEAIKNDDPNSVIQLIQDGRFNSQNAEGWTLFHSVVCNGKRRIVEAFLKAGVEKNLQDKDGWTPLHYAAYNGHEEVVNSLIEAGVDKDIPNKYGWTPLHYATQNGHKEVVDLLLKAGALVGSAGTATTAKDGDGTTPLHAAAFNGHEEIARVLITAGADKDARDRDGYTPLHYALENNQTGVVQLLIDKGAHANAVTKWGLTSLHMATKKGTTAIIDLLLKAASQ